MRRRYVALVLAVVIVFVFVVPIVPASEIVIPPPCGPEGGVTCVSASLYLASPIHALIGVGGYYWELSGNGTTGFHWHYGFDV